MNVKFLLIALLMVMTACHQDRDVITEEEIPDPPTIQITTKLVSQTDTLFSGARHATLGFAGSVSAYAAYPYLVTHGNQINRDFELISLTTQDDHQFYQVQSLMENDVNYLHWILPALQSFEGHSSTDGHFIINADVAIDIPGGSLQYADGTVYSGNYKIACAQLDPLTFLANAIPSYLAFDKYNQRQALEINTCFYIIATSESGQQLQFASAAALQFTPVIPGDHWYFEKEKAVWKSKASSGNSSTLSLGSSLYYSVAAPVKPIRISGTLLINNRLTPHYQISIMYDGVARNVFTTNKGAWALYVPAGKEIQMDVLLPCGNVFTTTLTTPDED